VERPCNLSPPPRPPHPIRRSLGDCRGHRCDGGRKGGRNPDFLRSPGLSFVLTLPLPLGPTLGCGKFSLVISIVFVRFISFLLAV